MSIIFLTALLSLAIGYIIGKLITTGSVTSKVTNEVTESVTRAVTDKVTNDFKERIQKSENDRKEAAFKLTELQSRFITDSQKNKTEITR